MFKKWASISTCFFFLSLLIATGANAGIDINFKGRFINEACEIDLDSVDQKIEMGTVSKISLYGTGHSDPKTFTLQLRKCDPKLLKTVTISFSGTEDSEQKGMLSLGNAAIKGVALSMNYKEGGIITPLDIMNNSKKLTLVDGDNSLTLEAYLNASQDAINNNTVGEGQFNIIATFKLNYA